MDGKEPILLGPDFPTGGLIINKNDLPKIISKGKGIVKLRGKYRTEKNKIIFYEIPYETTIEELINEIGVLAEQELGNIVDVHDESNKKGVRIVVEVDKKNNIEKVINNIFAKTNMQININYNQIALVNKIPTELGLKDYIQIYLSHNIECLIKEVSFDKAKAQSRLEIINGLLKALENIDNIINLIKTSTSSKEAHNKLINLYSFTGNQAKAIINMKLGNLAGLEKIELQNEKSELDNKIIEYQNILSSRDIQYNIIRERLANLVNKYGDERRTEIIQLAAKQETEEKAQIPCEDVIINIYNNNTLGRESTANLKVQKKRGKGVKVNNESLLSSIAIKTNEYLMLFSNSGKMYRLLVNDIPESQITNISDLLKTKEEEKIIAASASATDETKYIVFFTRKGLLKKTSLDEFRELKRGNGVTAIKLAEDDSIANAVFMNDEDVFIMTKNGMGIQFETKDIKAIGRNTSGVKTIKLADNDEVVCGIPSNVENTAYLALITENGCGKKISLTELFVQGRGGKGLQYYKVNNETGRVVSAFFTNKSEDKVLLSGPTNSICLAAREIPVMGRYGLGSVLAKNYIMSATLL